VVYLQSSCIFVACRGQPTGWLPPRSRAAARTAAACTGRAKTCAKAPELQLFGGRGEAAHLPPTNGSKTRGRKGRAGCSLRHLKVVPSCIAWRERGAMGIRIQEQPSQSPADGSQSKSKKKVLNRIVENRMIDKLSYEEYRDRVREVYDGTQGSLLLTCSRLSLHMQLGERLFRHRKFDLRGAKRILDVGSGAGQIASHLLKYADRDASITCFDLSLAMVHRAIRRLRSNLPNFLVADLSRLPF